MKMRILSVALLFSLIVGCTAPPSTPDPPDLPLPSVADVLLEDPLPAPASQSLTLVMVGDNLAHLPVVWSGQQPDGSYNFDHLFQQVAPLVQSADVAIINQETVLGGSSFEYTDYPRFNTPQPMGTAVANAGFNVVTHANNHAMDYGNDGMEITLDFWQNTHPDVDIVGARNRPEDPWLLREVNGINVAILAYTDSLNGLPLPQDKPWMVDVWEDEKVRQQVAAASQLADFTVVLPHWGVEYSFEPSDRQRQQAQLLADAGADLIIGSHPHVIQPVQWVESGNHQALVYYSLGNFLSRQHLTPRMLGAMAHVEVSKTGNHVEITTAHAIPLITHYQWLQWDDSYSVYLLSQYTPQLAAVHGMNQVEYDRERQPIQRPALTVDWAKDLSQQVLGDFYAPGPPAGQGL